MYSARPDSLDERCLQRQCAAAPRRSETVISAPSASAVAPSYIDALATSIPVKESDEALKFIYDLERALSDFGLIRCIGRIELAASEELDRRRPE